MSRLETMMMLLAQSIGFSPSQAEVRGAKSDLIYVPEDTVVDLSKRILARVRVTSDSEIIWLTKNIHLLMLGAMSYRIKMPIRECRMTARGYVYSICPRCHTTLDRDYQSFCDRCGQHLDWRGKITMI